jgi:8-amino-3,8-dideoxy-alpha-D-manno-octulosonate transaminase
VRGRRFTEIERQVPGPYPGALLIGREEERLVMKVLRAKSPFRYYGPEVLGMVSEFERRFARRLGHEHVLAVNSGTSALKCALGAVGVGPGDEVLVPAVSYIATADVVLSLGACPVFVDVDRTFTMDPEDLERKISRPRVRAVTPVHLLGGPAALEPILAAAREHERPVIEDCAQACGASYRGRPVGSIGDAAVFSFQINKIITAGEGGAVATSAPALIERALMLHDHGRRRERDADCDGTLGEGFRLNELSGAVLLGQLGRLDDILSRLRSTKARVLARVRRLVELDLVPTHDHEGEAGAALSFLVANRMAARQVVCSLNRSGVPARVLYGGACLYDHEVFRRSGLPFQRCPRAEELIGRAVVIPMGSTYTRADVEQVAQAIHRAMTEAKPLQLVEPPPSPAPATVDWIDSNRSTRAQVVARSANNQG